MGESRAAVYGAMAANVAIGATRFVVAGITGSSAMLAMAKTNGKAGTPTYELQRLGGWKTPSMVERYAHVAPEGLQNAAGRIDALLQLPEYAGAAERLPT
jgi:hypothetical protein